MLWPVTEEVRLCRVAVEVKIVEESTPVLLFEGFRQPIQVINFWEDMLVDPTELSVEVFTCIAGSEVPNCHPIWIHHGHYLKDVPLEQPMKVFAFQQIPDETLNNKG